METSPNEVRTQETAADLTGLYAALSTFQSELKPMERTVEVNAGTYKFKYTPLDEIMKNIYPLLGKNGLAVRHELNAGGIECVLTHKTGTELRSGAVQVGRSGDMKNIGGQITYARRYTLTMLLGIASEEDTDAKDLKVPEGKQTVKDAAQTLDVSVQIAALETCTTLTMLKKTWAGFKPEYRNNMEVFKKKEEIKSILEKEAEEVEDGETIQTLPD